MLEESFPLPGEEQAPMSSPAAQELQAQYVGLPADTREPDAQSAAASADDAPASEDVSSDEREPMFSVTASDGCPTETFGNDWYCFYQYKSFRVWGRGYAGQDDTCYSPLWTELPHERSAEVNWDNAADCFLTN